MRTRIVATFLLAPALALPADEILASWQNLKQLPPGQKVEIVVKKGLPARGAFIAVTDESISIRTKKQELSVARADVKRVRRQRGSRSALIGLGVGAGAGAGLGAGVGEGLSHESGGDFASLKPAIIGVTAALGALAGLLVGALVGGRNSTVYETK